MLLDGEDQDLSPLVLPRGDVTARNGINQVQLSHHPGPTFATARETNRRTASDSDAGYYFFWVPRNIACVSLSLLTSIYDSSFLFYFFLTFFFLS
ncbi:hypothetical protein CEXT_374241 [Caerostris extrusa]|uniref:Uncharacterized protein n=1 Tax=Caerostris extrusa TaxID=172846 RepID=A0AAV4Y969_CAEEX|nr:hypothetical protein CEXT_374241 [Caerostris extrusa]